MTDEVRVNLFDMILWAESEAERLESWIRVLSKEKQTVHPRIARNAIIARKIVDTLTLLKAHERDFVKMVKAQHEADQRANRGVRRASIATSSEAFTPQNDEADNTEPSSEQ